MKRFYIGLNIFLVLAIVASLFLKPSHNNITTEQLSRSLNTTYFHKIAFKKYVEEKKAEKEKAEAEEKKKKEEEEAAKIAEAVEKAENDISASVAGASVSSDVLETQYGAMSSFGPDCAGCNGYVAAGIDVRNNITYQDPTYGTVRIVAGDRKYPLGTIVRIKGYGPDFLAIVLDRGGDIGIGRRFMFDLLCPSEASGIGTHYNMTFEILRYGY